MSSMGGTRPSDGPKRHRAIGGTTGNAQGGSWGHLQAVAAKQLDFFEGARVLAVLAAIHVTPASGRVELGKLGRICAREADADGWRRWWRASIDHVMPLA